MVCDTENHLFRFEKYRPKRHFVYLVIFVVKSFHL